MTARPSPWVLVVEDDQGIAENLVLALDELGYGAQVGATSDRAWAIIDSARALPALILLDFLLSGEDGLALCSALKGHPRYGQIAVIVMSAHPGARARAPQAGADDFLPKPFDLDRLDAILARYLPVVR